MEAHTKTYHVEADQQGTRLDQFIEMQQAGFPGDCLSRTYIQKLIRNGAITVNGKACKSGHKIRTGDQLAFTQPAPCLLETPRPESIPLDILYEDSSLVIVNKPAGMIVHPAGEIQSGTLVNALMAHCDDLPGIGGIQRPGIVHRLDKDTSGVLVAAKTDYAHRHLSAQFEAHTTTRHYLAVICGGLQQATGTINTRITRSRRDQRKMTVTEVSGRQAITHYRVREVYNRFTFLELTLETGRMHQIRVHLSHIGHPVAGDVVYGGGEHRALLDATSPVVKEALAGLNRQALHAHTLEFEHPETNKRLAFSAAMPKDMQRLVQALKVTKAKE